jgi:3-dehydroquinate synthase
VSSTRTAPGSYRALQDLWGSAPALLARLPKGSLVLLDERVAGLHRVLPKAIVRRKPLRIVGLAAGEQAKSLPALGRVLEAASQLPRGATLLCIGGGTLGDLATVAAHLIKRGVELIHMPTTVLAAVDSSVGGKGALHVAAGRWTVKNAAGVFHYARQTWLCPELLETLDPAQLREGAIEAWKMFACLDAGLWRRSRRHRPGMLALIREGRRLKDSVCRRDPYELEGHRRVLNFGHTFGHVLETISRFRLSHGDAVGLGMLCALDVGRRIGITPDRVAREVEVGLDEGPGIMSRSDLARWLRRASTPSIQRLLAADKKAGPDAEMRMVLLHALGRAEVHAVPPRAWRALLPSWRAGGRP